MTTSTGKTLISTLAICLGLSAGQIAWADGGFTNDEPQVELVAVLAPTTNAPPGASGEAHLDIEGTNAMAEASLDLETTGLSNGTYAASVTLISDGSTVALGNFDITTPFEFFPEGTNTDESESHVELPLPPGLDPTNIASLSVSDLTGNVLLSGAFAPESQGDGIHGTEHLGLSVILNPTTNAPPGAVGEGHFDVEDTNGVMSATLDLEVSGLSNGTYTASVTLKSDGSTVVLGNFDVSNEVDNAQQEGDNVQFGDNGGLPLPSGLNPMDIGSLSISDLSGTVLLTGDFMASSPGDDGQFDAEVTVESGISHPSVTGLATVQALITHGKMKSKFSLTAQGLPAKSRFTVKVNGVAGGTVRSNPQGLVKLTKLPKGTNPLALKSVQLFDSQGHLAAKAKF